jgi:hypothetical protein
MPAPLPVRSTVEVPHPASNSAVAAAGSKIVDFHMSSPPHLNAYLWRAISLQQTGRMNVFDRKTRCRK